MYTLRALGVGVVALKSLPCLTLTTATKSDRSLSAMIFCVCLLLVFAGVHVPGPGDFVGSSPGFCGVDASRCAASRLDLGIAWQHWWCREKEDGHSNASREFQQKRYATTALGSLRVAIRSERCRTVPCTYAAAATRLEFLERGILVVRDVVLSRSCACITRPIAS
jgi:hypothetical protein